MDDLSGLEWSSANPPKGGPKTTTPMGMNQNSFYPTLRPTPSPQVSGRNTPLSAQGSGLNALKAAPNSKPANDSFSNLVNFGGAKSNANLSLRERQEQLEAEKRRKAEEQRKQMQAQYGGGQFWDNLGSASASRTASPAVPTNSSGIGAQNGQRQSGDDDDLFAAFNRNTKVDNASHYPPPLQPTSGKSTPANAAKLDLGSASAWSVPLTSGSAGFGDEDDDPFGLNELKSKTPQQPTSIAAQAEDDDFLGDLGKPVEEVRRKVEASKPRPEPGKPIEDSDSDSDSELEVSQGPQRSGGDDPFDKAVAELVDMGFTPENARRGLTESGGGLNIQAAVGWLLDDAHRTARQEKQSARDSPADRTRAREDAGRSRNNASPAWMREENPDLPPRRDNRSPAATGDLSQKAAAMGTSFFKTANSLWKQGQKQVQKAVADFNQEGGGDPNQPKWMRSAQPERPQLREKQHSSATDEAMMLESGMRPEKQPSRSSREPQHAGTSRPGPARDQSPVLAIRPVGSSAVPKWQQSQPAADPRARLNKQLVEEQSAQAYVSPARRKKATPQPQPQAPADPEVDLFSTAAPVSSKPLPQRSAQSSPAFSKPSGPSQPISRTITPRPAAPTRQIPSLPPATLQASTRHRLDGTAHFKRGDFDAAHTAYTNSLRGIPQSHPLCIVLLTNRSLTALKTGSPKQAVDDADAAIAIIGPSRGDGEKVALGDGEQRDMKELYGKALSRKAEALEQMEKWADAGNVWQQCVEAGLGGASAIAGRQRCQKALAPKPKPTPKPVQAAKPRPRPSATSSLAPQKSSEAVQRLREANKAAEAADDEKFALSEKVDARISAWRDGKRDNIRALIGSLDQVLWENSGWKKVGLHELVMANRVKIHYMKAIAKTHPDKLPQDANTEVRLIAATVFATLNESWDKFKAENGL
ncbi:putative UBA domain-containing protein [Seiridium unicorne]|uniref:UBA domain-containing protein n=1 Tax=Seiridium unicorne TaxID=138068 RepID=A0ABR2UYI8_9PEZI